MSLTREDIAVRLVSTCIGLTVTLAVTYFGMKRLSKILDPTHEEKKDSLRKAREMLRRIGVTNVELTNYELCIAANLVDPISLDVKWSDIGGLDGVIDQLKQSVVLPFKCPQLFEKSSLLKPPTGVLLHGPPGCGKTMIAKALAKATGARFLNLQVSSLFDKWYGESQKRAEAVFSLAMKLQPTIIFIDEIDSFMKSRSERDNEATAIIKTQFMTFWDGLTTDRSLRIMIVGATNRAHDVDAAILRRMPSSFYIGYPNQLQREVILNLILAGEKTRGPIDLRELAEQTEGLSGSDLREMCRDAAMFSLQDLLLAEQELLAIDSESEVYHDSQSELKSSNQSDVQLRGITMDDLQTATKKMQRSRISRGIGISSPINLD